MLAIIGCGNLARSDDGVGVVVVQRLGKRFPSGLPRGAALFDAGTDGMATMFQARGASSLILIDACRTGSEPGAVFEVPGHRLETVPVAGLGLHGFRWEHALYAGRQIFREAFPDDVTVLLVEASSVDHGLALSPPVSQAADLLVEQLHAKISQHGISGHG